MTNLIDHNYFRELAEQDPEDVCRQACCQYDPALKAYMLKAWGDEYAIYPEEFRLECVSNRSTRSHDFFYLFLIYYLLKSKNVGIHDEWISEKDIPGGATFFRGPHKIPTRLICRRYGNDIESFKKRCERLGGFPVDMADAAYRFEITPRLPVAVLYWLGDEAFPPEAKILYDRTITEHLPPDIIFALSFEICTRIAS